MTKRELMKALEQFPDDMQICVTVPGSDTNYMADKAGFNAMGTKIVIEAEESPDFNDIINLARRCLDVDKKILEEEQLSILSDMICEAERLETKWNH